MPEEPQGTRQENRLDGWRHWMASGSERHGLRLRGRRARAGAASGKGEGIRWARLTVACPGPAHMSGPGSRSMRLSGNMNGPMNKRPQSLSESVTAPSEPWPAGVEAAGRAAGRQGSL